VKSELPNFSLNFGGYWFELTPEDYIVEVGTGICAMCLQSVSNYNQWILGDTFMRGWYNIHDHANTRIGFYPLPGSTKKTPTSVTAAANSITNNSSISGGTGAVTAAADDTFELFGLSLETFARIAIFVALVAVVIAVVILTACYYLLRASKKSGPEKI